MLAEIRLAKCAFPYSVHNYFFIQLKDEESVQTLIIDILQQIVKELNYD